MGARERLELVSWTTGPGRYERIYDSLTLSLPSAPLGGSATNEHYTAHYIAINLLLTNLDLNNAPYKSSTQEAAQLLYIAAHNSGSFTLFTPSALLFTHVCKDICSKLRAHLGACMVPPLDSR